MIFMTLESRNFATTFLYRRDNESAEIDVGFKTEKPYVPLDVTRGDLMLGSVVLGFFVSESAVPDLLYIPSISCLASSCLHFGRPCAKRFAQEK
ncbi:hypothetical protein GYMLUDRAFT_531183 [Collybiopsis luxurians FD-317 M1]|nr:hypothetical protein GYMLUDRAFT_531183 [Collybiopsis luxurians FD-317 M1]